ncbi:hypothetical protein AKJ09_04310 [Labilithrix luteola]|uniref:TonB C-terminal domain-containing protein n=1 Tax=Labilithrix luteola TaxID=1391654 RepID=A0A0K1PW72_9BACT|nr:AgmX/PglI C-terminal domain-containing protein [Labilithrix luteola]AKU97646.1 hypothetical protein AKJ09_04310 [Labilithrix luteola]
MDPFDAIRPNVPDLEAALFRTATGDRFVTGLEIRRQGDEMRSRPVPADDLAPISACWKPYFASHEHVHGRVEVHFAIRPNGAVSDATVHDADVGDARLLACVTNSVRGVVFDADADAGAARAAAYFLRVHYDAANDGKP